MDNHSQHHEEEVIQEKWLEPSFTLPQGEKSPSQIPLTQTQIQHDEDGVVIVEDSTQADTPPHTPPPEPMAPKKRHVAGSDMELTAAAIEETTDGIQTTTATRDESDTEEITRNDTFGLLNGRKTTLHQQK